MLPTKNFALLYTTHRYLNIRTKILQHRNPFTTNAIAKINRTRQFKNNTMQMEGVWSWGREVQITLAYTTHRWRRKLFAKLITTASSTLSFPPLTTQCGVDCICVQLLEELLIDYKYISNIFPVFPNRLSLIRVIVYGFVYQRIFKYIF